MYRRYYNEYEKKAKELSEKQKCTSEPSLGQPVTAPLPVLKEQKEKLSIFGKLRIDDILLVLIIWLLLKEEKKDMALILALGFIFLCDFKI